jgi:hypothetical protein
VSGSWFDSPIGTLVYAIVTVILSTVVFFAYINMTGIGAFQPASLPRVLEGTAARPYTYRILVPVLAVLFSPLIPESAVEWIADAPAHYERQMDVPLNRV